MKNKLFKRLTFLFVLLVGIICNAVYTHVYALQKFEITSSEIGNIIAVYNEEAGGLSEKLGVVRQQIHEHHCEHIAIVGKMNRRDFITLVLMAIGCRTIDLSNVEVDVIPRAAFFTKSESCSPKLEKFVLPSTLKIIEDIAFANRSFMKIDNLPLSLEFIGNGAFMNCWALELTVPEKVKIVRGAFCGCNNVRFSPDSLTQIIDTQPENSYETACLLM
jgi:hypothetical protein